MTASSSWTSGLWAVLKVAVGDEFHRMPLGGARDHSTVEKALQAAWDGSSDFLAFYVDEEGDECRLVCSTFADFLSTAKPSFEDAAESGGRPVLRVRLHPAAPQLSSSAASGEAEEEAKPTLEERHVADKGFARRCALDAARREAHGPVGEEQHGANAAESADPASSGSPEDKGQEEEVGSPARDCPECQSSSSSDPEEEAAAALVEEARRACEGVLAEHLRAWLAEDPPSVTFEAWLAEVHPENVRRGVVDSRMYLEESFHRQLWNKTAARAAATAEEGERRLVPPRQGSAAAALDRRPSAPLLSELVPVPERELAEAPTHELAAAEPVSTPMAPPSSELPLAAGPSGKGRASDARPQAVWKLAATPYLAQMLPLGAVVLRGLAERTDRSQPELPEELRAGYRRLAEGLAGLGPAFSPVANAAADLADGRVLQGAGVAALATRAAQLPFKDRLVYAELLCDCCSEAVLHCFPDFARPRGSSSARCASADQLKATKKAMSREIKEARKAAKRQHEAAVKHLRDAKAQAAPETPQGGSTAKAAEGRTAAHAHAVEYRAALRQAREEFRAACEVARSSLRRHGGGAGAAGSLPDSC